MFLKSTAALAAAIGLVAAPVAAAPSAAKLSIVSSVQSDTDGGSSDGFLGGSGAIIAGLLVLGIIAIPVIDAIQDDNNDSVSP